MRLLALAAALLALAACGKSPCEELGSRICSCQASTGGTTSLQSVYDPSGVLTACNNAVQAQLGASPPSSADEQACQSYLSTCPGSGTAGFCATLQTPAGKVACGMAYSPNP